MRRVEQKESGKRANELCAVVNILTAHAAHKQHQKNKKKTTAATQRYFAKDTDRHTDTDTFLSGIPGMPIYS